MKIVCFGPGPKFKGGISNYNTALAKAFDAIEGNEVHIVSWTQQYPAIIPREFVDKSSTMDFLDGTDIQVHYETNYNNPMSWYKTYQLIRDLKPDMVIFQWAIAIQGLPLGRIVNWLKKHKEIEVLMDLHFVIQKENSSIDKLFTKMGIVNADHYIVHALKTYRELKELFPNKKLELTQTGKRPAASDEQAVIQLYHPIYSLFQPIPDFDKSAFKAENNLKENVFLFFGFIRKYKGLHNVIPAFKKVVEQRDDVSLLICGESFWQTLDNNKLSTRVKNALFGLAKSVFLKKADDERNYNPLALVEELGLQDRVAVFNEFIPNEDVPKYFQASDCVVLYYETATPSGIESLSYNFELPIVATKVGHFPETIDDGYNGYLAEANDIASMAEQMLRFLDAPIPREHIAEKAKDMSWENYARTIMNR